jgi:hypothetical protein
MISIADLRAESLTKDRKSHERLLDPTLRPRVRSGKNR